MAPLLIAAALEIAKVAAPGLIRHLTNSDRAANVAEQVINAAQELTGTGTPQDALAKLKADPNLVLQFHARALELESLYEQAVLKDRQDARGRDVELRKLGYNNSRADLMVLFVVVGLLCCLWVLVQYRADVPGEVVGILSMIAGIFGACLKDAFAFEFGSSRGSKEKDELLARGFRQ